MDSMAFLLNFSFSGIKNIEKEIKIDFYGKNVSKRSSFEKNRIKGIYGENGTGKTAIITAIDIVRGFILDEDYLIQNRLFLNDIINKNTKEFIFKCEFVTDITDFLIHEYEIHFVLDENGNVYVSNESLSYTPNNKKNIQRVSFSTENGEFTELNTDDSIREEIIDKTKNLLTRQSALWQILDVYYSRKEYGRAPIYFMAPFLFFIMLETHFDREDKHRDYYQRNRLEELRNSELSSESFLEEMYKSINANERRVRIDQYDSYEKKVKQLEHFIKMFKPSLKKIDIEKRENKDFYECRLLMDYGNYRIDKEFESTGIKKIMEMFDSLLKASAGGIVFIDEMDSNINDIYLCKLIEYFKYFGRGQLCFTSHNTDPMTVLKDSNKAIDFLTRDNRIVPWIKNGHYTPDNSYRNGMIEGMPFNIDSSDFISIFEGGE